MPRNCNFMGIDRTIALLDDAPGAPSGDTLAFERLFEPPTPADERR